MVGRIFLAGLAGAVVMFVWTSVAHMLTPLASAGFQGIPNEAAATSALQGAIGEKPGLYLFPYVAPDAMRTKAGMDGYMAKTRSGPSGLLLYRPPGGDGGMSPEMLISEFLKQLVVCVIAAFLLAEAKLPKLWERAGFVAAIGVIASLETNVSYRIWYMFPGDFTAAAILMSFIAYAVAGFAIAAIVKPTTPRPLA